MKKIGQDLGLQAFSKIKELAGNLNLRVYRIKSGLQNIIQWWPLIWNDRDWDFIFIYRMLYKKLERMEKLFKSDKVNSKCAPKKANQLFVAKNLCKRLIDNNYTGYKLVDVQKTYGNVKIKRTPSENKGCWNIKFIESKKERAMRRKSSKHIEYLEQQDKDYLFNHINKYINGWWD